MDRIKNFKRIMEKSESTRVIILTNHYRIEGSVYECDDCNKDECINLTNATICNIEDVFDDTCDSGSEYDWLHVNMDKIVAFSFV